MFGENCLGMFFVIWLAGEKLVYDSLCLFSKICLLLQANGDHSPHFVMKGAMTDSTGKKF